MNIHNVSVMFATFHFNSMVKRSKMWPFLIQSTFISYNCKAQAIIGILSFFLYCHFLFVCLFSFCHFLGHSQAYGSSQAGGWIGAIATGLRQSHSNVGSERICDLPHSSQQFRILNPLSKARDWARNLLVPSRIR